MYNDVHCCLWPTISCFYTAADDTKFYNNYNTLLISKNINKSFFFFFFLLITLTYYLLLRCGSRNITTMQLFLTKALQEARTVHRRSRYWNSLGQRRWRHLTSEYMLMVRLACRRLICSPRQALLSSNIARGLLKYNPKYEGVLLAYDKVKILPRGHVQWDMSHIVTQYSFEGLIFRPKVGDILTGTVNNLKNNHIGLKADGIIPTSIRPTPYRRAMFLMRKPPRGRRQAKEKMAK